MIPAMLTNFMIGTLLERPERELELNLNNMSSFGTPPFGTPQSGASHFRTISEMAVESTANYARSIFQLLSQPCQDTRAFAWVYLRDYYNVDVGNLLRKVPLASGLRFALTGAHDEHAAVTCGYVACIRPKFGEDTRPEVLVATARGCAHIYDWNPFVGGECRLHAEHSFTDQWLQHERPETVDSKQTVKVHQ